MNIISIRNKHKNRDIRILILKIYSERKNGFIFSKKERKKEKVEKYLSDRRLFSSMDNWLK